MEENRYMAKMRVHELAKELNIKSQEVIDTLNGTQFAVKNVQSGLEDEAQQIVRKKYAKTEVKKEDYDVLDSVSNQVYINYDEMKEKWQNNYDAYLKKIKEAVNSTKGEVILYNNNLIDAVFFSTSNGYTENSKDVFSSDMPYLVSVYIKYNFIVCYFYFKTS